MRLSLPVVTLWCVLLVGHTRFVSAEEPTAVDYQQRIAPILDKYCVACHNNEDREGGLSLESYEQLQRGGKHGPALLPGNSASSRLLRLVTGQAKPKMPPDDADPPSADEVEMLRAWIDGGARGPAGIEPERRTLIVPSVPPQENLNPAITALACSQDGRLMAIARFRQVELIDLAQQQVIHRLQDLPGKVASVRLSGDGRHLLTASGVAGLFGQAAWWDVSTGQATGQFGGHRDLLYAAEISPQGKLLATAGYDRQIILWDLATGQAIRQLTGHNDAVYQLAFSPDGSVLASASGDQTVKLWRVDNGQRLDTLSQPLAEQYVVRFSPDGQTIVAGGADNRIRVWRFVSRSEPAINPLIYARFAHEGPITQLEFTPDGRSLVSAAEDRSVKLWETTTYTQVHAYPPQSDLVGAIAMDPSGASFHVGRLDGTLTRYEIVPTAPKYGEATDLDSNPSAIANSAERERSDYEEQEPNDAPRQAQQVTLPARVAGRIHVLSDDRQQDTDLFRFVARQGEQLVLEVEAARQQSPLDSKIEVLDQQGQPIPRVLLQAVRDSYFTFRGKDSDTSDDFRVHNWQEMELNELLYANGEVVKLWLYPRGPDSGFQVYPGSGKRHTYFDTTPISHPLHEPCYIVEPHWPGSQLIDNGLPVFPIYYENDDESRRQLGTDSKLFFTAPYDGTFVARVSDTRSFHGEDYRYQLSIRRPKPDFKVTLQGANPAINRGSGKEFQVRAERMDGFDGEIRVDIQNVPAGFYVTSPVVIEAGQESAIGVIFAKEGAEPPAADQAQASMVTATAQIGGNQVTRNVNNLGTIKLEGEPKLVVELLRADDSGPASDDGIADLTIAPGQTIMAKVRVQRKDFQGPVSLGGADSGRNLPHGVYVDNIGLNGLLIVPEQSERMFFITAAKWVPETTRLFHLRCTDAGQQASMPIRLHVRRGLRVEG